MNKEEAVDAQYVKKTTTAIVAVVCLAVGFFLGIIYSATSGGGSKVRRITTTQPAQSQSQAPQPQQPQMAQNAGKIMALEKEVNANPTNAVAWAELGHAYFDSNQHANAVRAYNKHLELNPNNANVWTDLGVMHRRSGNPQEAIRCFDKAISIDHRHQQSRFNKGVVLMHDLKKTGDAIKAWEELLAIFPNATTPDGRSLADVIKAYKK